MLNEFRVQTIVWDKANSRIYETIKASEGDSNGRKLRVQILDNGVAINLSGSSLSLAWESMTNKGLDSFDLVDANKGIFEIFYTTEMLSTSGKITASLVLVDSVGRLESVPFGISISRSIVEDDSVQSDNSFTTLTQALVTVNQYDSRITNVENTKASNEDLEKVTAQLAQTVKYPILDNENGVVREDVPYGHVTRYGAVSGADSTQAITNALNFCNDTRTTLHFPKGVFLDSEERIVQTNVSGEGLHNSEWVYTENTGQHVTIDGIYREYLKVEDLKIRHVNRNNIANGVYVARNGINSSWGGAVRMIRSEIAYYGGIVLHLSDTFNAFFQDCKFEGLDTSTVLFNESNNSITNVNTFEKCVFLVGRIGIRTYNVLDMHFSNCTFETFDLFLNAEDTGTWPLLTFEKSHFENFKQGIINAKLNVETLEPVTPIQNKFDLNRIKFSDNQVYNIPDDPVDPTINPEASPGSQRKYYFYFTNGLSMVGSGRYYYPTHGWVFKTTQGMFVNTVTKNLTFYSEYSLRATWELRDEFVTRPNIQATINEATVNLQNSTGLVGVLSPTIRVDGTTVIIVLRRLAEAPAFKEGDTVTVDLVAISNWK